MQDHKSEIGAINSASGVEFEKLYVAAMAKEHQGVLTMLESAKPKDKNVQSLVQGLLPTVRKHLADAQRLQNTSTPAP